RGAHLGPTGEQRPFHLIGRLFGDEKVERRAGKRILDQLLADFVQASARLSRSGRTQKKTQAQLPFPPSPPLVSTIGSPQSANSLRWVKRRICRSRASSTRASRMASSRCSSQLRKGSSKRYGAIDSPESRSPIANRRLR